LGKQRRSIIGEDDYYDYEEYYDFTTDEDIEVHPPTWQKILVIGGSIALLLFGVPVLF
jgi:hypothetical protein